METLIKKYKSLETPFIYHENMNFEFAKENSTLTKEEVLAKYYNNEFTLSDLLIAKALAKIVFGTRDLITKVLQYHAKLNPEKPILTDSEHLKIRLAALCKGGILKRFKFTLKSNGKSHSYYCLSPHGYNYIKRILNFKDNYDQYLAVTPVDEVMKYLACAALTLELMNSKCFKDFNIEKHYYIKGKGKYKLYSEVKTIINDEKNYILIEPLYFNHDKNRLNEKEINKNIVERLHVIHDYVKNRNGSKNPTIIFVCENLAGIKRAMEYTVKQLTLYHHHIYFTTDAVAYNMDIEKSLLRIDKIENNKPTSITNTLHKPFI